MKLTGKCKDDFEKYMYGRKVVSLTRQDFISKKVYTITHFYNLPESMQYGVYVDFFDSVDMDIVIERRRNDLFLFVIYLQYQYGSGIIPDKQKRPEARARAIEKANEIYNKK